jgi:hypothetical protein
VEDLLSPLHDRPRDADEVAVEDRVGEAVPCVLLAGRDDQRRLDDLGTYD